MKNTTDVMAEKSINDCIMDIMPFLVWATDMDEIIGGVHAKEALASFGIILGYHPDTFEKMCDVFRSEPD